MTLGPTFVFYQLRGPPKRLGHTSCPTLKAAAKPLPQTKELVCLCGCWEPGGSLRCYGMPREGGFSPEQKLWGIVPKTWVTDRVSTVKVHSHLIDQRNMPCDRVTCRATVFSQESPQMESTSLPSVLRQPKVYSILKAKAPKKSMAADRQLS